VVLRRGPDGKVFKIADLPSVQGLRVDQLLTSEHFGLNSTIEPALDRLFKRYYELKGLWKLSAADKKELKALEEQLADRRELGRTRREQLVLEAADEYLATETRPAGDGERRELREATKKRIAKIWASTEPAEGPPR
ncbi:MAG: AAA family ATPase, partial [Gaiellaceae bacterium]